MFGLKPKLKKISFGSDKCSATQNKCLIDVGA
jgi:hypothetical protein